MHYQLAPYEEVKIVSCRKGVIYDVIVDLRKESSTYGHWIGIELSADRDQMIYIPAGLAHGFQTLSDDVELFYFMGNYFYPEGATGIRWDDPFLKIPWPNANMIVSEKDKNLPGFNP